MMGKLLNWVTSNGAPQLDQEEVVRGFLALHERAAVPTYLTNPDGHILAMSQSSNGAASEMIEALELYLTDAPRVFYRIARGIAQKDYSSCMSLTHEGDTAFVSAERIATSSVIWRICTILETDADFALDAIELPFGYMRVDDQGQLLALNTKAKEWANPHAKSVSDVIENHSLTYGAMTSVQADPDIRICLFPFAQENDQTEVYLLPVQNLVSDSTDPADVLKLLPIPLALISQSGRVISTNPAAQALTDNMMQTDSKIGAFLQSQSHPIAETILKVAQTGIASKPLVARFVSNEFERFLQIGFAPIAAQDDTYLLMVMSDATELKTLEAQFVQGQKMQAIGQLAGGVAHDFNNLLTAISGYCDLLLLRHQVGDRDYTDLIQIQQNAHRAAALVRQLLAFSRKQTLQPRILNLQDVLGDLSHLLNRLLGERVTLSMQYADDLPKIRADVRQFEQVIMNLVVNARDAMIDGGNVSIVVRGQELKSEVKRDRASVPPGHYMIIEVTDTGTGIPKSKLNKIFDPFFTTKRIGEGTGLGLSTAYGIVKQSNGFIFVDSIIGEGTTFTIYFPAQEPNNPEANEMTKDDRKYDDLSGHGLILLVEDEAPVRAFASRALTMRGYTVVEASSGEEALQILEDLEEKIDLIISDVVMPGLDGPSWVEKARPKCPDARIIFVSGYAEDAFPDGVPTLEDTCFLAKPFSLADLAAAVKDQIDISAGKD